MIFISMHCFLYIFLRLGQNKCFSDSWSWSFVLYPMPTTLFVQIFARIFAHFVCAKIRNFRAASTKIRNSVLIFAQFRANCWLKELFCIAFFKIWSLKIFARIYFRAPSTKIRISVLIFAQFHANCWQKEPFCTTFFKIWSLKIFARINFRAPATNLQKFGTNFRAISSKSRFCAKMREN